jgi:NADPH2:quinone reductase
MPGHRSPPENGISGKHIMKAVVCKELGKLEDLRLEDFPAPEPGPDEVLIKVAIAGVNFPDQLIVKGQYQASPALPFVPGFEVAGSIVAVGSSVEGLAPGQRVAALTTGQHGGYAEYAVARTGGVVVLPDDMSFEEGTAFYSSYGTACHALVQRGHLAAGETLVVLGAAGGVGLATIELGKAMGANVIAVASSDEKLETARRHGADHLVNYRTEDLKTRIEALTGGRGADVCMDPVGGKLFDVMSRRMAWDGRLLVVGFASGTIPSLPVNLTLLKSYQVAGVFYGAFSDRFPEENRRNFDRMFAWHAQGLIHPEIQEIFPLDRFDLALAALTSGEAKGRLLLKV